MANSANAEKAKPSSEEETRRRKRNAIIVLLVILLAIIALLLWYFLRGCVKVRREEVSLRPTYRYSIYGSGDVGPLNDPLDVAVNPKNNLLYVADTGNHRIVVFARGRRGKPQFAFDKLSEDDKLKTPDYLAINQKGEVYVSDRRLGAIFVFDKKGRFKKKFTPSNQPDLVWDPLGLYFDKKGNLYATDVGSHRILKFDSKGKLQLSFGEAGATATRREKKGKLYFPNDVCVDSRGNIYVSDSNNRRVQVFTPQGKPKTIISAGGLPRGLFVSRVRQKDYIYVVDAFGHQVDIFTSKGNLEYTFGEQGTGDGQFLYPNGVALAKDGTIYVTDRENKRIQVWK